MSTKYLARTVIEGGRRRRNRWDRRHSSKVERASGRQVSGVAARLDELDDVSYRPRKSVWREFSDKLAPAERWLRTQVGRPWDNVRGEIFGRFDTRTTAGRHIVFCHLLRSIVIGDPVDPFRRFDFQVDRHGILRYVRRKRKRHVVRVLPEPESALLDWLDARRIGDRDGHLYWFVATPAGAFRQASELDPADAVRWRALPEWFRERWDAFAPRVSDKSE